MHRGSPVTRRRVGRRGMRLGIDYGTVATRAVLAWPDGRWSMVTFDGADRLSSGVYVDADALAWAGQLARDRATADPAGFVPYPKRHLTRTHIQVRDRRIEVVDLVAATLHHVGEQAARAAGQPADEVTLTVPAGWGPARRTLLRRAATRAGLPQPHLVDTPTAVANHLLATGITVPVGTAVLMCDFGAGRFEATILTRGSEGFEVLSTVESLDAGGLALDTALADHPATLTATLVTAPTIATPAPPTDPATATPPASPAYLPAPGTATADTAAPGAAVAGTAAADMVAADSPHAFDGRLAAIEAAHAAIQTLAHTPAVAVPTAAGLPIVTDQPTLHTVAGPVVAQIGQVARTAVTAADHTPATLVGVYCYGGGLPTPIAVTALTTGLADGHGDAKGEGLNTGEGLNNGPAPPPTPPPAAGQVVAPVVVADPEQAAVRGAVHAAGQPTTPPAPPTPPGKPGIRHYAALVVPAADSLVLLIQATSTAYDVTNGGIFDRPLFVIANWGEYGTAGLLAVQTSIAVALLGTAHLARILYKADPDTPPDTHRILSRLLPAAAATGVAIAALYGAIGAVWHRAPEPPFLRATTLYTAVPTAALATTIGLLAARRPHPPAATWLDWLTTPPLATALAATGIYLTQYGTYYTTNSGYPDNPTAAYLGAACYGVGAALTLPIPRAFQVLATAPLALAAAVLTIGHARTTLAAIYILTVIARYATRAVQLTVSGKPNNTKPDRPVPSQT